MTYIVCTVIYLICMGLMIMAEVKKLRVKYPDYPPGKVFGTLFMQEWNTLIVMGLVLALQMICLYLVKHSANQSIHKYWDSWVPYASSAVLGYAGWWLVYSLLGSTAKEIERRISKIETTDK